jgi:hypothetical protein
MECSITSSKESIMNKINWTASDQDIPLIQKIATRAVRMAEDYGTEYDKLDCVMDITACHLNGTPLKLEALLKADDFNFSHDVFGIRRHMDRETCKLGGFFLPRFTDTDKMSEEEASHA